jgi:hypothetical protein
VEHRQQSNAEIHNDMYLTLTGQEDYVNPFTHEVERGSNEWKYRWVTPSGEEVYSNADNYDPNFDSNTNRTDFKRSTVRQRARDRRGPGGPRRGGRLATLAFLPLRSHQARQRNINPLHIGLAHLSFPSPPSTVITGRVGISRW